MFSKFEKIFVLVLCIMVSIVPVVWYSKGEEYLQLIPWAGFVIIWCLGGFILDRMFFQEKPSRDESDSGM